MPKEQTIRFYTAAERYVGWQYLSRITYFELLNWLNSKNYIMLNERKIDSSVNEDDLFALLRSKK